MSAINAIQLVRAPTPRPRSRTERKNAVMKNGVGLITGNLAIARSTSAKGSEAANAGMVRCTFVDSGKNRCAAKTETEKKNAPELAATIRNPAKSISAGPTTIQRKAETKVRTMAVARAMSDRRRTATKTQ